MKLIVLPNQLNGLSKQKLPNLKARYLRSQYNFTNQLHGLLK
jgi:hypothetical protein